MSHVNVLVYIAQSSLLVWKIRKKERKKERKRERKREKKNEKKRK